MSDQVSEKLRTRTEAPIGDLQESSMSYGKTEDVSAPSKEASTSVTTPEELKKYIVSSLMAGKSYRRLESETGISKSQLQKLFPKGYIDALRREMEPEKSDSTPLMPNLPFSDNLVVVPLTYLDDLEKSVPKAEANIIQRWKQNIYRFNELLRREQQAQVQTQGNPSSSFTQVSEQDYPSFVKTGEDAYFYERAQTEKKIRPFKLTEMMEGGSRSQSSTDLLLKAIQTGVSLVPKSAPAPSWQEGWAARDQAERRVSGKQTNLMDLKLEELRERHDVDMEQMRWEKEKFFLGKEEQKEKNEMIKDTLNPVNKFLEKALENPETQKTIQNTMRRIGESVGKGVENTGSPSHNIAAAKTFTCPECKTELSIPADKIPSNVSIKCLRCGLISPIPEAWKTLEKEIPAPAEEKPANITRLKPTYM